MPPNLNASKNTEANCGSGITAAVSIIIAITSVVPVAIVPVAIAAASIDVTIATTINITTDAASGVNSTPVETSVATTSVATPASKCRSCREGKREYQS